MLKDPERNLSTWLDSSYASKAEVKTLKDKDKIKLGNIELEVIHTPGHTRGGSAFYLKIRR